MLVVRPGLGARTVEELVALARTRAESISLGTVGGISNSARALMLLEQGAGIRLLNVPYGGGALYLQAVVAEQIDGAFSDVALALPFAVSGAVHILGCCESPSASRSRPMYRRLPRPASRELYRRPGTRSPLRPGTPAEIVADLVVTLRSSLASEEVARRFAAVGCEAIVETPEESAAAIRLEYEEARALAEYKQRRILIRQ